MTLRAIQGGALPYVTDLRPRYVANSPAEVAPTPKHWFSQLTPGQLAELLAVGLVEPCGATADAKVVSYRLTAAGRILLNNRHD